MNVIKFVSGGVTAAKGFRASGVHCGIRKNRTKKDLALIVSDSPAAAAGIYTLNLVKGAPIAVTKSNIANGYAQCVICNSGNANTCNANGIEIAEQMCALVEKHTGIPKNDVIVASTGVIGQPLDITPISEGMEPLCQTLSADGGAAAAEAIMTTDTVKKEVAVEFVLDGKICRMGGIAKGSGMIHPNMATMLVFITTDASVAPKMLQKALSADAQESFNMISIDGDTSTNDMVCVLANGMAGNKTVDSEGDDFEIFKNALAEVTKQLCRMIATDGEGATKMIECRVTGAKTKDDARTIAKSVICSSLFKAAMFGADANWGRVLCAIGYSGADTDINGIGVEFSSSAGNICVCVDGAGVEFSEEKAKEILLQKEITVNVTLKDGGYDATAWGCDLTYDYVKINGDYRT